MILLVISAVLFSLKVNSQECGLSRNAIRTTGFVQGVDTSISKVWLTNLIETAVVQWNPLLNNWKKNNRTLKIQLSKLACLDCCNIEGNNPRKKFNLYSKMWCLTYNTTPSTDSCTLSIWRTNRSKKEWQWRSFSYSRIQWSYWKHWWNWKVWQSGLSIFQERYTKYFVSFPWKLDNPYCHIAILKGELQILHIILITFIHKHILMQP